MPKKSTQSEKKKKTSAKITMRFDVYNTEGKIVDAVDLPKEIFAAKINNHLMAQAVRVYLANQRHATASTKSRGEVRGSTRKIYRQKGTGRARHGSIRAPIFVHGGVALGPSPRDYSLKLPKKMKQKALFSALSAKLKDNEIKIVDGFLDLEPKTKHMQRAINALGIDTKNRKILFVLPSSKVDTAVSSIVNAIKAVRNLRGVEYRVANQLNTYEVLNSKILLLTKESVPTIQKTFIQKEKE